MKEGGGTKVNEQGSTRCERFGKFFAAYSPFFVVFFFLHIEQITFDSNLPSKLLKGLIRALWYCGFLFRAFKIFLHMFSGQDVLGH